MKSRKAPLIVAGVLVTIPVVYIASCSMVSERTAHAFELVKMGDTEQRVIEVMGAPVDSEYAGAPLRVKYGGPACSHPCAKRLWYLNSMSLVGEAWSVELDSTGHVVQADHLTSP